MVILNEKEYVENVLIPNGEVNKKPTLTLMLLAKYYKSKGKKPSEVKDILNAYMARNYDFYLPELWEKTVNSISRKSKGMELREVDGVPIYKAEIEKIAELNNPKLERLAFGMLCYAKMCNISSPTNNGWINCKINALFKSCNIAVQNKDYKYLMIHELFNRGYIALSNRITNMNMQVQFMNESGDVALMIKCFESLGYEYDLYRGNGNYTRCEVCGTLFKAKKGDNRKYCKEHTGYQTHKQREVECINCGKVFFVDSTNSKTCRCEECQTKEHNRINRENMRKSRQKQ